MKAEINNENKAKFFAQYWGQKIVFDAILIGEDLDYVDDIINHTEDVFKHLQLLLKPLSSISDEDAEVIELQSEDYNENGWWDDYEYFYWWSYNDVDYLRSKGYALPYLGLSVEEMIKSGWIKLIE